MKTKTNQNMQMDMFDTNTNKIADNLFALQREIMAKRGEIVKLEKQLSNDNVTISQAREQLRGTLTYLQTNRHERDDESEQEVDALEEKIKVLDSNIKNTKSKIQKLKSECTRLQNKIAKQELNVRDSVIAHNQEQNR